MRIGDYDQRNFANSWSIEMPPTPTSSISTKDFWSRAVPMTFEDQPKSYEEKRIFRYSLQNYMHEEYRFQDFKDKKVLEIGVGSGIDAAEFLRNGANVIGIDFSSNAIRNANLLFKEAKVDGQIILADARALPFTDSEFDAVYSYGVIHHIPDIRAVLREVKRVLKPGGLFMGMAYNRDSLLHAYSIIYLHGILEGLLSKGKTELDLASNFSERFTGNPYTALYTANSLTELLENFFKAVTVRTHYNVIDTAEKRKVKFELEGGGENLGWHLAFKAIN